MKKTVQAKVLADVRALLELLPSFHRDRDFANARFEGAAFARLLGIATVIETGDPEAHPDPDGPEWVREIDKRWRDANRPDLGDGP